MLVLSIPIPLSAVITAVIVLALSWTAVCAVLADVDTPTVSIALSGCMLTCPVPWTVIVPFTLPVYAGVPLVPLVLLGLLVFPWATTSV